MEFQGKILFGNGDIIVNVENSSYHATNDHPNYSILFEAYKNDDVETFLNNVEIKEALKNYCVEKCDSIVVTNDGRVYYGTIELNNSVTETIKNMMSNGLDFEPMLNFLKRTIDSNSRRVVDELFKFIEYCGLSITKDGCFLAYKTVLNNYMDKYSGTIDNSVGSSIPRLERWRVDDNCNNACSHGYHVGGLDYAGPGGWYNREEDRVMICKVAPEDVVSVPLDHSCKKMRVCWYEVIGEFHQVLKPSVYSNSGQEIRSKPQMLTELTTNDLVVDEYYCADYINKHGEIKDRYFLVLEKFDDYVTVELCYPESDEGGIRRFNFDRISNIQTYDPDEAYEEDCDFGDEDADDDEEGYMPW